MEPNLTTVRDRRALLAKARQQIDAEDKEMEVAERALTRLAAGTGTASGSGSANGAATPVTQRDLVISTLKHRADPWVTSSADLADEIEFTHGTLIKPTSLLPLLTTLKNEGIIRRDAQNRIVLAERV